MCMARLALLLVLIAALTSSAVASAPVRVSLVGKRSVPIAGRTWKAQLAVRPRTFRGAVRVKAMGGGRIQARASQRRGSYVARLVFPAAGRWVLTASAGGSTSRLGSVRVLRPRLPLILTEPTAIDWEPAGTLLVVENSIGRLLRVDPATGRVAVVASGLTRPYAVVRAPSGAIFVTTANVLKRIDGTGAAATVAEADSDIGPLTVGANGDVFYSTATRIFRLAGGAGPPVLVAGTGVQGGGGDGGPAVDAQLSSPHGLAVAADGALLVADSGNNRIRRIDSASGVITRLADVGTPHGMDVGVDGTIYVVEADSRRIVHLTASGARIGLVGPRFGLPYDVEVAADGVVYVLEAGPSGRVRRIGLDGKVTTVSRR